MSGCLRTCKAASLGIKLTPLALKVLDASSISLFRSLSDVLDDEDRTADEFTVPETVDLNAM